jgi:hypothetical protein
MRKQLLSQGEHTIPICHRFAGTGRVLLLHNTQLMIKIGRCKTEETRVYIADDGIAQANSNIEHSRRTER